MLAIPGYKKSQFMNIIINKIYVSSDAYLFPVMAVFPVIVVFSVISVFPVMIVFSVMALVFPVMPVMHAVFQ